VSEIKEGILAKHRKNVGIIDKKIENCQSMIGKLKKLMGSGAT
jgi:hypothetical protein